MKHNIIWAVTITCAGATGILWAAANSPKVALAAMVLAGITFLICVPLLTWVEEKEEEKEGK